MASFIPAMNVPSGQMGGQLVGDQMHQRQLSPSQSSGGGNASVKYESVKEKPIEHEKTPAQKEYPNFVDVGMVFDDTNKAKTPSNSSIPSHGFYWDENRQVKWHKGPGITIPGGVVPPEPPSNYVWDSVRGWIPPPVVAIKKPFTPPGMVGYGPGVEGQPILTKPEKTVVLPDGTKRYTSEEGMVHALGGPSLVPAWPGIHTTTLPDGTVVKWRQIGDEHGAHFETDQGVSLPMNPNDQGFEAAYRSQTDNLDTMSRTNGGLPGVTTYTPTPIQIDFGNMKLEMNPPPPHQTIQTSTPLVKPDPGWIAPIDDPNDPRPLHPSTTKEAYEQKQRDLAARLKGGRQYPDTVEGRTRLFNDKGYFGENNGEKAWGYYEGEGRLTPLVNIPQGNREETKDLPPPVVAIKKPFTPPGMVGYGPGVEGQPILTKPEKTVVLPDGTKRYTSEEGMVHALGGPSLVPAWPGIHTTTLPDGTVVKWRQIGDEHGAHFETDQGVSLPMNPNDQGFEAAYRSQTDNLDTMSRTNGGLPGVTTYTPTPIQIDFGNMKLEMNPPPPHQTIQTSTPLVKPDPGWIAPIDDPNDPRPLHPSTTKEAYEQKQRDLAARLKGGRQYPDTVEGRTRLFNDKGYFGENNGEKAWGYYEGEGRLTPLVNIPQGNREETKDLPPPKTPLVKLPGFGLITPPAQVQPTQEEPTRTTGLLPPSPGPVFKLDNTGNIVDIYRGRNGLEPVQPTLTSNIGSMISAKMGMVTQQRALRSPIESTQNLRTQKLASEPEKPRMTSYPVINPAQRTPTILSMPKMTEKNMQYWTMNSSMSLRPQPTLQRKQPSVNIPHAQPKIMGRLNSDRTPSILERLSRFKRG